MINSKLYVQPVLKGKWLMKPEYLEQEVNEYCDNPCIKALPHIFDDKETTKQFLNYPQVIESEKHQRANVRYHNIRRLEDFIQPLSIHLKIEHTISSMIRRGYLARNPASKEYLQRLRFMLDVRGSIENDSKFNNNEVCRRLSNRFEEIPETMRTTAISSSIIGTSGMGKSLGIEKLFLMYPQVIIHHEYNNIQLTITQIVWLKLDCPHDGSLKTLCKMFFQAIDEILLTTHYYERFGNNRNSTATMMINMAYLASLYSIGIIAIDEMQHLINPKNSPDDVLNFLVTLVNTIGVPIIQIGTSKVVNIWKNSLAQLRRAQQGRCIIWDRMEKDASWDFFIESMWELQWLCEFTALSKELNEALYYHSQGITSIAVNLYALSQAEAIFNKTEKITCKTIEKVAKDDLRLTLDLIKAIRNNNKNQILKYEDVKIKFDELFQNKIDSIENTDKTIYLVNEIRELSKKEMDIKRQIASELVAIDLFRNLEYSKLEEVVGECVKQLGVNGDIKSIKQIAINIALAEDNRIEDEKKLKIESNVNRSEFMKDDLRGLFRKAVKTKAHICDLLENSGYIKNPEMELIL